jgi:tRNA (mo5U34)-methyltransferase
MFGLFFMSSSCQIPTPDPPESAALIRRIQELGKWFHNLDLHGVPTAPDHFLGDFPNIKWRKIAEAIPQDLTGASVLDVGCNAGFYSIEMKRRGASRVLGIDIDDTYLNQARFAAETLQLDIEFRKCSVYQLDNIEGNFDYVVFMGVFYHLRYPLYALDQVLKKLSGKLVFQTMLRGSDQIRKWARNYSFWQTDIFLDPGFPVMYFVEKEYSSDPTNWWIPNRAAAEAILRSSGLDIISHPEEETWICEPRRVQRNGRYLLDLELAGEFVPEEGAWG